jgi:CubicO group peptidase (beta-lactamase class C family)
MQFFNGYFRVVNLAFVINTQFMKRFLKIFCIVIGIIVVAIALFVAYAYYKIKNIKDTHDLQARVDKICTKYVSQGKAAGLFVGIVQGDTVYMQCYGVIDKDSKIKPDSSTVFEIGSLTKVFTAEITQLLVDQKMLSWDDNIAKYLPQNVRLPANDNTTLMNLVSHTSGFPRVPEVWFKKLELDTCNPYSKLALGDLYDYLNIYTDKKAPSLKSYEYSNLGAGLLGHILEWRTGKTYETLIQEYVCAPLQMTHTSTTIVDSTKFATGYDEKGNKTCHWTFPILTGCGAIRSTGEDMLKFLKANMGNNSTVSRSFLKTQTEVAAIPGGAVGYGWHIDKMNGILFGIPEIVWHNGGTGGFRTYMAFVPGTHRGIIVMANQTNDEFDELAIE